MEIEKPDLREMQTFADKATVDTRSKIMAKGVLPAERHPYTACIRMTEDMEAFLDDHVKGNKSLAILAMLDYARRQLKKELSNGNFNIKKWLDEY